MIKKNHLKGGGIILTYLTELPNEIPIEILNEINHYIKYSIYKQITDAIKGLLDIKFKKEDDTFKKIYKDMIHKKLHNQYQPSFKTNNIIDLIINDNTFTNKTNIWKYIIKKISNIEIKPIKHLTFYRIFITIRYNSNNKYVEFYIDKQYVPEIKIKNNKKYIKISYKENMIKKQIKINKKNNNQENIEPNLKKIFIEFLK